MKKPLITFTSIFLLLYLAAAAWADVPGLAELLQRNQEEQKPIPVLSKTANLDEQMAYQVQKAYVQKQLSHNRVAGFKGGLTSPGAQKKFGLNSPVAGVLFTSGKITGYPVVDRKAFRGLLIETEIAFLVGQPIDHPLKDVGELKERISAVLPAIELPEAGFANLQEVKGVDVIAANVGAVKFIAGLSKKPSEDINNVRVTLYHNGRVVNQGKGSEVMGDQWQAALWLVNKMIGEGYKLEPGQILMTGALGQMLPGQPGKYLADYGSFGKVYFTIN